MKSCFTPQSVSAAQAWVKQRLTEGKPFRIQSQEAAQYSGVDSLSTAQLCSRRFFEPDDMVFGVEAGTLFQTVYETLRKKRMILPVNPWWSSTTIGGLVAANRFGPNRMDRGGIRDAIIGIEYLNGQGQLVKAGGKVVKNVTGYDLGKMMTGSLGGLGLITAVNFKMMPAPIEPRGLFLEATDGKWLSLFRDRVYLERMALDWVQAVFVDRKWKLGMGISGNSARRQRLISDLQMGFDGSLREGPDDHPPMGFEFFSAQHRFGGFLEPHLQGDDSDVFHLHLIVPTGVLLEWDEVLGQFDQPDFIWVLHPVGGDLHLIGPSRHFSIEKVKQLAAITTDGGGYLVQERVPSAWLEALGPVLPLPSEYALMLQLKRAIDPKAIFYSEFYESPLR